MKNFNGKISMKNLSRKCEWKIFMNNEQKNKMENFCEKFKWKNPNRKF